MRIRTLTAITAAILLTASLSSAQDNGGKAFREALGLYEKGLFDAARLKFEAVKGDPLCEAYAALSAVRAGAPDSEDALARLREDWPEDQISIMPQIHFYRGSALFDAGKYEDAMAEFDALDREALTARESRDFVFKYGYSAFETGNYDTARGCFSDLSAYDAGDYEAAVDYALGYMAYSERDFPEAIVCFGRCARDPRFKDVAEFFILDSRFMMKDYDYVTANAEAMLESCPAERRQHLMRILSESLLVKGDIVRAKEYYDAGKSSIGMMSRGDYFYAGSLLYATGDYQGAVDNFLCMKDRTDSLGQAASYKMADAYLQLRNKVSALESFKQAAALDFDPVVKEDAFFNYAKLSFDLNEDSSVFSDYMKAYSTSSKGDRIYDYLALAALIRRDYDAAIEAYDQIESLNPVQKRNYVKANYLRANQLMAVGSYSAAVPCLKAATFQMDKNTRFNQLARYWLGESQYRSGSYDDAIATYSDLYNISALPGTLEGALIPYNLGYCYFKQENYTQAVNWFGKYILSGDGNAREDALTRLADCDFVRRDFKTAIRSYQTVLDDYADPDKIYPYYQQALAYSLTGDKESSARVLSRVLDAKNTSPMYSDAMYELGKAYMETGRDKDAIGVFERLKHQAPEQSFAARASIGMGMVYRNRKSYDKALECYKEVVENMPESGYVDDALIAIESICQTMRRPDQYLAYIESIGRGGAKTDADKEEIYFNTAEQTFLGGDWNAAVASLDRFLAAYPSSARAGAANFYLAESYKQLGVKEKACESYAKVITGGAEGSYAESSALNYADLSYGMEKFSDALAGYVTLGDIALIDRNKSASRLGRMRSAYRVKSYDEAVKAADEVAADTAFTKAIYDEALYTKAKSEMASSRRSDALKHFSVLAASPDTRYGAEAAWVLIQDACDKGDFATVEDRVYDFSQKCGDQMYWLAKAYITLGDSFVERGNYPQAKATYESIQGGYQPAGPDDDIQDVISSKLANLSTLMAK